MAFLALGVATQHPVEIDDGQMIATSFPGFAELFNGLGNINNYRSTKASQVSAEASADATAWNVEAETTRRFYEILRAIRQLELEQVLLEQFQDRLARTERLFAVTTSQTQEDVLGARADAATQPTMTAVKLRVWSPVKI